MKFLALIGCTLVSFLSLKAQNGYIRLSTDSLLTGYIKTVYDFNDNQHVLEFWRTKNDKDPARFFKSEIEEYAINKDTFRILRNFQPFPSGDFFLHDIDAEVLQSGRIELLKVRNPYYKDKSLPLPIPVDGGVIITVSARLFEEPIENVPTIFILRTPRNNFMRGVPSVDEAFREVIHEFFSPLAIESFEKENGKLTFRKLEKLVAYYNIKTSKRL